MSLIKAKLLLDQGLIVNSGVGACKFSRQVSEQVTKNCSKVPDFMLINKKILQLLDDQFGG